MLIVDSQIHLWQNGKMSAHHRQIPTYSVNDALAEMASAGVDCAVIHPPSSLGEAVNVLAVEAARLHPDKFCILGHLDLQSPDREKIVARWRVTDDAAFADLPAMLVLAKHSNVAVKMSGAPSYSSQPYPYKNIHGYLRQIFEAFGPERSFWGTDITRMPCSYRQCVTMFTEELPWLKGRDLERVMGGAVVDWLGWKRPAAA